jgi:hypothetical protein
MVQFSVPVTKAGNKRRQAFAFCVKENAVLFAGSRNGFVPEKTARGLVSSFARLGFSFVVGCASGIDRCFRKALAASEHTDKTFVACAFVKRIGHIMDTGLFASCVVPHGIPPKAALARRTLWMVKRASLIVLFPDNPENDRWGKGSTLVFNAAVMQLKPLFVVSKHKPEEKGIYRVLPACFQGLIEGYWVIPHPIQKGGTCDDEY